MKANIEMTWREIFKIYLLFRTLIPLAALALFLLLFGNTSSKGKSLLVSIGVIIGTIGLFGILNFLYISIVKLFNIKIKSDQPKDESEA